MRNVALATHAILGGARRQKRGRAVRDAGGAGGYKLKDKRQKGTKHKQEAFQGKGKGEAVEKRKRPLSEGAGTAGKAQREKEVGGAGAGGGAVKKGGAKCPHNR